MEEDKEINSQELMEKRKKQVIAFFKKTNYWVLIALIIAVILGVYIRSLPMQDHSTGAIPSLPQFIFTPWKSFSGTPGTWDITTNTWTLGPDLDPWLFTRYAKTIVEQGSLPEIDHMRNVPLGTETAKETRLLPYMIAGNYYIFNTISDINVEFAAVVFPVVMFALTIISFFLFVREVFARKDKESKLKANIIALISTFIMIVIPAFLSRTVAGIPEKESAGFFFMFLSFYLFLKGWKTKNLKTSLTLGILAGISTAAMALIWGGVSFVYVTIATATFLAFILNKVTKKEFLIYTLWIFFAYFITLLFSARFTIKGFLISLDTGLAFLVFFILLVDFVLWNTKLRKNKKLEKIKIPPNILSIIIAIILIIVISSVFLGPSFMIQKLKDINRMFFTPVIGRWNITVAENRQPYFTEWARSFGPFIKNIPVMFWLFFIGSVVLFKKMLDNIKNKDAWILTIIYIIFFFGLVFSRYSASSTFNGENTISKGAYYLAILLLAGSLVYYRFKYYKEKDESFQKTDYELLFLFSLFALCLFSARSAVRIIMVLAPIAPIFLSYLVVESADKFRKTKEETGRIIFGLLAILLIILTIFIFWNYYQNVKGQAYGFVPSYYNHQWQKAMEWVREETPENAVFAHWWDYGYWVQSIGNRATVTDGGNAISFWNYWTGRLVLTGPEQEDALEFLYAHNATHLLIDSTDIGKYTAFSSIGSDENYDRYSWIPVMTTNNQQIQETRDGMIRAYQGGSALDEDIFYETEDGARIELARGRDAIVGILVESSEDNGTITFSQPQGVFYKNGQQIQIPLRYLYFNREIIDFETGINGTAYVIQRLDQTGQQVRKDELGAVIYISPRVMRGLLGQVYLLDDPFNNFPNFKLTHTEQNIIIENLNSQNMGLREFVYYQGLQGPIKIWEIEYTGEEEFHEKYLDRDSSKYISWRL
jgi:asparagine N-glycosylation enzyme membrane subunit Stt3